MVAFILDLPRLHSFLGGSLVIKFDELGCVDLIGVLPSIVTFGVALPFDQIL